ncbi:MAG TPA: SOS response-associated peptidase [Terriglobales bacterium]|nr:SOS response-associated peptidase [Terriglobales bacterium]
MCGRYRLARKKEILAEVFDVGDDDDWSPRYNIAPSQSVPVIRQDATRPVRTVSLIRWGLIPFWAKDAKAGYKMINARAETIAEKPAFREPLLSHRCLIPADGFYEWVRHEVACVTVRRALPDRTCHPIGSTLRGMAFRKRIV